MTANSPEGLINRLWWLTLLRGVLTVALGLGALLWPAMTVAVLFAVFGFFSIVDGVIAVGTGLVLRRTAWGWTVFQGIAGIVIGILALRFPQSLAAVIVIFFAFWALVIGLFQVATAVGLRAVGQHSWGWVLASGALTSLLGLYFLINPDVGGIFLVVTVGWFALVAGAVLVFGAFQLRRAKPELAALLAG
ncbi:MAG: HdeD family acid-resistance protein [Propionicimonas sp.]